MGVNQSVIIRVGYDYTYEFKKKLGQGAFGEVFLVQRNFKFSVIKKLERREVNVENMISAAMNNTEIQIIAKLNHPNVVKYEDSFFAIVDPRKGIYIVMEYCEHGSLQDLISRGDYRPGSFLSRLADPSFIINWMMDICRGLGSIHSNNVIHRDIKPANILIHGSGCLKIGDFGLSNVVAYNQLAKTMCGTPRYMAPEVLRGSVYDKKCDMWSVGVVLFDLLSCRYLQIMDNSCITPLERHQMSELHQLYIMLQKDDPMYLSDSQRPSAAEAYAMLHSMKYPY